MVVFGLASAPICAEQAYGQSCMQFEPRWEYVADTVMGGVSQGRIERDPTGPRDAMRLLGDVSLDNNGGFIQIATDLAQDGRAIDLSAYTGVSLDVRGNGATYDIRLRTTDLTRPWQAYRQEFQTVPNWTTLKFPFSSFQQHRTETTFDPTRLRRIGILAIGREFAADVSVANLCVY